MDEPVEQPAQSRKESSAEWAERLTGKLSGLLKEELAAYGGGEAFIRWVRGHDDGEDDPWVLYGKSKLSRHDEADTVQGK